MYGDQFGEFVFGYWGLKGLTLAEFQKEAIHIRLHPNNINRDSGITEIPEAWTPTIRQHNCRSLPQQTAERSVSPSDNTNNALD